MKTIVTHFNPDVDSTTAVWLVKNFLPGWEEADIAFVPAGETLKGKPVDSDDNILHLDTGLGKFDHHQMRKRTCAARLVFEYLRDQKSEIRNQRSEIRDRRWEKKGSWPIWHEEALDRLTQVVVDIDHFGHVFWPKADGDIYDFSLESMLGGWKLIYQEKENDRQIIEWGMRTLDGISRTFVNKVWAEHELKDKGWSFNTRWGKALAIETVNDDTLSIAQKRGYVVAVRKDAKKGYVRIKGKPGSKVNLKNIYQHLKKEDPQASWYLHISNLMILNGSSKNPKMRPSKLSLKDIVRIIKLAEK